MPEFAGARYELFQGRIYMTPSPNLQHARISMALLRLLDPRVPPGHEIFLPNVDLDLVDDQRAVPDLVVIADEYIGDKRLAGPALLVVEIVSPKTKRRDLGFKRDAYAASGVQHYWVIDGKGDRVIAYRLNESTQRYDVALDQTGGLVALTDPIPVEFTLAELGRRA